MPSLWCCWSFELLALRARRRCRLSDATRILQIGGHGAEIELAKGAHHHWRSPLYHRFSRKRITSFEWGSYPTQPHFVPPLDGSREAAILRALGKGLLSPAAGVYASTYRGAVSVVSVSLGTLDPRCTPLARDRSPAGSFRSVEHIATRPAIPQSA